jgi:hypothetical protein
MSVVYSWVAWAVPTGHGSGEVRAEIIGRKERRVVEKMALALRADLSRQSSNT